MMFHYKVEAQIAIPLKKQQSPRQMLALHTRKGPGWSIGHLKIILEAKTTESERIHFRQTF